MKANDEQEQIEANEESIDDSTRAHLFRHRGVSTVGEAKRQVREYKSSL